MHAASLFHVAVLGRRSPGDAPIGPVGTASGSMPSGVWLKDTVAIPAPEIPALRVSAPIAGLLFAGAIAALGCASEEPPPNVLLITIDTIRADHLSAYGYELETTPELSRLAGEGVRFDTAYASTATTAPSHVSLFTSLHPVTHRVVKNGRPLAPGHETLAEILSSKGFDTAGIVSSYVLSGRFDYGQGFDTWNEDFELADVPELPVAWDGQIIPGKFHGRADDTTRRALSWLRARSKGAPPFFLFVHYYDPHDPYDPPSEFADRFGSASSRPLERVVGRYDAEIAFTDQEIGRLLAGLSEMGLARDTIVVVTGDHGEGLMQHGHMAHGVNVYEEAIRVPLLFRWPGGIAEGASFDTPVGILDIAPTLLELLGIEPGGRGFEGRSLAPVLRGDIADYESQPIWSYRRSYEPRMVERTWVEGEKFAVRKGRWKYILGPEEQFEELFDLEIDPGERQNLFEERPEVAGELRELVESFRERVTRPDPEIPVLDQADRARLEALGYVE